MIELFKTIVLSGVVLVIAFLVALHMPNSPLRDVFLRLCHIGLTVLAGIYIVSPIDIVPDVFFPIGFADDLVALVFGYQSLKTAINGPKSGSPSRN